MTDAIELVPTEPAAEPDEPFNVAAPEGSEFLFDEVSTAKGTLSLGHVPILTWNDLDKARAFYGDEGICDILGGTSLRVSFQAIARRLKSAKKNDNTIANAQLKFRPGKRQGGASTPASRATRNVKSAIEKTGRGEDIERLLARIAAGEIDLDKVNEL